jgi:hypothetical protein
VEDAMANDDKQGNAFDLSKMSTLGTAYQRKILEITQANAQAAFEFGRDLMSCRAPEDFMRLTQDYTKKQVEAFQQQAKELMELARTAGG